MMILHIGNPNNISRYTPANALDGTAEVVTRPMGLTVEEYRTAAPDAEVLIADAVAAIPAELIAAFPKLKLIHSEGVAYNRIDCAAARAQGVSVCNSAGMNASAVAEQAVLLMLAILKDSVRNDRAVREGRQMAVKMGYIGRADLRELADLRVGLIGFGAIGKATARLLNAFGAEVVCCCRHPLSAEQEEALQVHCLPMEELLATADIVSLHLPVTPETTGMCNDSFFAYMKEGACLVNTARGEIVDDGALIRALASGHLTMAALDTLDLEPVQPDHPLLTCAPEVQEKLIFSPHIGGITGGSFRRSYRMIWENIERLYRSEPLERIVN